ncbi:hypothetical protein [Shewanella halifaxensis]|uniref:hypothetical protein n=1 Tax=Shewanella halifaxensis TaxID=271098 RepID=UPI000D59CF79|nr:hypothetical protein [Shewanella halifaxensis]
MNDTSNCNVRLKSLEKFGISFSDIEECDLEMIRQWRNSPEIRQFMVNSEIISPELQKQWFEGLKGDKTRLYSIVYLRGNPLELVI